MNMNDVPRQKLRDLIAQEGRSLIDDPQRCRGLLQDYCSQYQREVAVLSATLRENVPTELQNSQHSVPTEILIARLVTKLQDNSALNEAAARWAVETWALALGVITVPTVFKPAVVAAPQTTSSFVPAVISPTPYSVATLNLPAQSVPMPARKSWLSAILTGSFVGGSIVVGAVFAAPLISSKPIASPSKPQASPSNPPFVGSANLLPTTPLPAAARSQSPTAPALTPFSPEPESIAQDDAVDLVQRWLQAKREIFAPPYSQAVIGKLTTGALYADLTRAHTASGAVAWLKKQGAYYRYGVQRIESVEKFVSHENNATLEVSVTEERTLFKKDGHIDPNETDFKTRLVRYSLELTDGTWKIADYRIL